MLPRMPKYLHQVIAIDRGIEADAKRQLEEIKRILAIGGKQDPLTGITRTHTSLNPERWPDQPEETRRVQVTVADLLAMARKSMIRLFDIKYTREAGNCVATADVRLDGEVILADVPLPYLLFLEARTLELIALIDRLPVLDPAEDWHDHEQDPNLPRGWWASAPRETLSTTRAPEVQILYKATPEHPAQVRPYETDVTTGRWRQVKFSGQLPMRAREDLRDRAVKILEAIREAREQANTLQVDDRQAGDIVLGYILGDLVG